MNLQPGDLLLTRSKTGIAGRMIRLGAALLDQPNLVNHVAVYTHTLEGIPWGVEGKPGGVGSVDCRKYLSSKWTINNIGQPKTDAQRLLLVQYMNTMIGTQYDWVGIAADFANAIHLDELFRLRDGKDQLPGQVVCSSLAAYAYRAAGLVQPGVGSSLRTVTPGDWDRFIIEKGWAA